MESRKECEDDVAFLPVSVCNADTLLNIERRASVALNVAPLITGKLLEFLMGRQQTWLYLVLVNEVAVGFVRLTAVGPIGTARSAIHVTIDPPMQGRGYGTAALRRAERIAAVNGCTLVSAQPSCSARRFVEKRGYRVSSRRELLAVNPSLFVSRGTLNAAAKLTPYRQVLDRSRIGLVVSACYGEGSSFQGDAEADLAHFEASGRLDGPLTSFLTLDGEDIGLVRAVLDSHTETGWIEMLAVVPQMRRQGFGRLLLAHAVNMLRERNVRFVQLHVDVSNSVARALYYSSGFARKARQYTYVKHLG